MIEEIVLDILLMAATQISLMLMTKRKGLGYCRLGEEATGWVIVRIC